LIAFSGRAKFPMYRDIAPVAAAPRRRLPRARRRSRARRRRARPSPDALRASSNTRVRAYIRVVDGHDRRDRARSRAIVRANSARAISRARATRASRVYVCTWNPRERTNRIESNRIASRRVASSRRRIDARDRSRIATTRIARDADRRDANREDDATRERTNV